MERMAPAHPEQSQEEREKQYVKKSIDALGIDFHIEEYPELWLALTETGVHFEDALCMAREINVLWNKLKLTGITREKMMLCAVLHDVGKAGPNLSSVPLRKAVRHLFVPPAKPFNPFREEGGQRKEKSVHDFMLETDIQNAPEITRVLGSELGIDVDTKLILDFWRDHADWTYALLQKNRKPPIDDELVTIASMHHVLEGRNPANIPLDDVHPGSGILEMMDKYQALALIDKYQAFRWRNKFNHEKAIMAVRGLVERNRTLNPTARNEYNRIIDILEASGEALTTTLTARSAA
jgi:hypothetical protein